MVFPICHQKGSELPKGHPDRKYKGRYVFQGNQVKDEFWDFAIFNELSSSPSSLEAAKAADCYGLLPDRETEQADAEQACVQAGLCWA